MSAPVRSFDRLAASYDELWTTTPIGRAQRDLVWREIDPLFQSGDRILDIGCGTGEDAAHFTARGVTVHAFDPAPAMVEVAQKRGGFTASVLRAEEIAEAGGMYHGAISNFGALNCVDDLRGVARDLAALVPQGSPVAICVMGRFCVWETLYYAARFQFRKAFRRLSGMARADFTVYYPTVAQLSEAFAPGFQLQRWSGIGLFVPPSYVSLPDRLVGWLNKIDFAVARLPFLRALADHRLLIFVRK
jgi:SAM-dependent methyltransferase